MKKTRSKKSVPLKVPKCEIFDGLDFHYYYIVKSLWGGGGERVTLG
jgi:hypothetical protein